jgi:hypothetical protein
MSALPSRTDIARLIRHVCQVPTALSPVWVLQPTQRVPASLAETIAKEPYNGRIEIAVKSCPVEARHVGANLR